jgi:hypothetical protein
LERKNNRERLRGIHKGRPADPREGICKIRIKPDIGGGGLDNFDVRNWIFSYVYFIAFNPLERMISGLLVVSIRIKFLYYELHHSSIKFLPYELHYSNGRSLINGHSNARLNARFYCANGPPYNWVTRIDVIFKKHSAMFWFIGNLIDIKENLYIGAGPWQYWPDAGFRM